VAVFSPRWNPFVLRIQRKERKHSLGGIQYRPFGGFQIPKHDLFGVSEMKKKQSDEALLVREYAEREGISTQAANYRRSRLKRPNGKSAVTSEEGLIRIYADAIWTPEKRGQKLGGSWAKKSKKMKRKNG
jgi:hypothetical protein